MTDLTTRAREMCEGGKVDPQIVVMVYELCDALEKANAEVAQLREAQNNPCQNCQSGDPDQCGLDCMEAKKNK